MAFVYEEVGMEQVEFANSLGFKDWSNKPLAIVKRSTWYADKENNMYMKVIGDWFRVT